MLAGFSRLNWKEPAAVLNSTAGLCSVTVTQCPAVTLRCVPSTLSIAERGR